MSVWLFWCSLLSAEPYPALFDVVNVGSDDALNVRSEPDGSSDRLGELRFDRTSVEVMASDATGRWGLVNIGERSGWVALRFLRRRAGGDYALAGNLRCFGTEPFWSLDIVQGRTAVFSVAGEPPRQFVAGLLTAGTGRPDRFVLRMEGQGIAVLRRAICTDGMSDQTFGLDLDLVSPADGQTLFSGCCSIAPVNPQPAE